MADAVLELGLASNMQELEDALWEIDIRLIHQLIHARSKRNGIKTRWVATIEGSGDDIGEEAKKLEQREFSWLSEQL